MRQVPKEKCIARPSRHNLCLARKSHRNFIGTQLQLKRFTIKRKELKKVHTRWRLDTEISIGQKVYDLSAVILHIGVNAGYGHYLTVSDGFKYDDELVEAMEYREIPPEQIYLMFYTLRK